MSMPIMKNSRSLAALFLIFFLSYYSCQPPVTFSEPQPPGKPDMESFPARLKGEYLSSDSSYYMSVDDKMLVRHGVYTDTMIKSGLDSVYLLKGDTLCNKVTGEKIKVSISGDSIFCSFNLRDTVFRISDENLLRKWKGYFFINMRRDTTGWEVKKISLEKGILNLSSVGRDEDIEKLNELAENPSDTIPPKGYQINKNEFRKFIKGGGFEERERFIRLGKGGI